MIVIDFLDVLEMQVREAVETVDASGEDGVGTSDQ